MRVLGDIFSHLRSFVVPMISVTQRNMAVQPGSHAKMADDLGRMTRTKVVSGALIYWMAGASAAVGGGCGSTEGPVVSRPSPAPAKQPAAHPSDQEINDVLAVSRNPDSAALLNSRQIDVLAYALREKKLLGAAIVLALAVQKAQPKIGQKAVKVLEDAQYDTEPDVRKVVAITLAKIANIVPAQRSEEVVNALANATKRGFKESVAALSTVASGAPQAITPTAVNALASCLSHHQETEARFMAASALYEISAVFPEKMTPETSPDAIQALNKALKDDDERVRKFAAHALLNIARFIEQQEKSH